MMCCLVTGRRYRASATRSPARRSAVDAEPGGRLGLQAGLGNRVAALLADAVRPLLHLVEGVLDLAQRLHQRVGQRLDLAPLGRDLAGVGEALVERVARAEVTHLLELRPEAGALLFELGALGRVGHVGHRPWSLGAPTS